MRLCSFTNIHSQDVCQTVPARASDTVFGVLIFQLSLKKDMCTINHFWLLGHWSGVKQGPLLRRLGAVNAQRSCLAALLFTGFD